MKDQTRWQYWEVVGPTQKITADVDKLRREQKLSYYNYNIDYSQSAVSQIRKFHITKSWFF